jgi:hypothetical protein
MGPGLRGEEREVTELVEAVEADLPARSFVPQFTALGTTAIYVVVMALSFLYRSRLFLKVVASPQIGLLSESPTKRHWPH